LPDFPDETERAVRGLDFNDRPVICGGKNGPGKNKQLNYLT